MTLIQLKYLIKIANVGSFNKASELLFVSQPSLSKAIKELEEEMKITIFYRNNRGVYLSESGTKFLSYARQVVEQADNIEKEFKRTTTSRKFFAVSSQHYAFVVNAFVKLVEEFGGEKYDFSLRETKTSEIFEDVRSMRSELGVIYLSEFNKDVISNLLNKYDLKFHKLFRAKPHVFVSKNNPLAKKATVTLDDIKIYPKLVFEQGNNNSFYFSEELHSTAESLKNIIVTDRATLFNLLIGLNGYTISSGVLSSDLNGTDIVSVPLISNEYMDIGYICSSERPLSRIAEYYVQKLKDYIVNMNDSI